MSIHAPFPPDHRVAVLIDGDNIGVGHAAAIGEVARRAGRPDLLRVYGDAGRGSDWRRMPGFRFIDAGEGKNAADVLLCIDAMEIAGAGDFGTFVLASNDSDFTHLARRLRERGLRVIGVGTATASRVFGACCSRFEVVGAVATSVPPTASDTLDHRIKVMIASHGTKGRGMSIATLGALIGQTGLRIGDRPEKTWRAYLQARPSLFELDPRGPNAMVRFRPEGFPAPA